MPLESIQCSSLHIPFNATFKHASAERATTETFWVEARSRDGISGFGEGCPRAYVTSENIDSASSFFSTHARDWLATIHDLNTLTEWVGRHRPAIDRNPAAWSAVELALLDVFSRQRAESAEALLGLPELAGRFRYTAVLGDASPRQFEGLLDYYLQAGFSHFKIKLSGDRDRDLAKVRSLAAMNISPQSVRADANNLWNDATSAISALDMLDFPFFAVEEPLCTGDYNGMNHVAAELGTKIILDESFLRLDQLDHVSDAPERWIINLRVSKMGGLLRSIELMHGARERGVRMIIGAHVGETSLLTRVGLAIANCAGDILLAQEGAFGTHLLAFDVIDPPIMFGKRGILETATLGIGPKGFGLAISEPASHIARIAVTSQNSV